ncbi:MAG: 2-C-methyl-D-erythritol 4-phosphate cytidylyltransferase [Selenomonadaceae bacterium]|nr:2-C-methyl-D-erythritol 4-phosphate cytidylyltransferase [Selenomonadaceae bacterium]MBR4694628.1 2-C-methyl-D-erythritol 4-phosphate cytidylyltransferase [Selenomonadaceae bacterium]
MNIALILAGGMGSRMGQEIPKQFIHVDNRPVIIYTLLAMQRHSEIDRIQAVCIDGWEKVLAGYARQFGISKLAGIVSGGETRFDSTRLGMESLGEVRDDDVIIVHDSVRPLVTAESLSDTIAVCRSYGNSMTILECADTMYERTNGAYTSREVLRSTLVRGQTPEAVTGRRMREMYAAADERGIRMDSISAMQNALGWNIHFAKGSERNIKLTSTEDIELFKALLSMKKDEWLI